LRNTALLEAAAPVVFFANALGDHLMNRPALAALASLFKGGLTLLARTGMPEIFFPDIPFARVIEEKIDIDHPSGMRRFDAAKAAHAVGECDLLLSLNPWHSPDVDLLIAELNPPQSVGFFAGFQTPLPLDFTKHSVDLAFDVARLLAGASSRPEDYSHPIPLADGDLELGRSIREKITGQRLLLVHNESKTEKRWSEPRMAEVLERFLEDRPEYLAIVLGEQQSFVKQGRWIEALGLPLRSALGLMAQADLFLGVDSMWLHAADLWRIPGVGIFGPTSCREFGFRFCADGRHLQGADATDQVSVDAVLDRLFDFQDAVEEKRKRFR
jgi:ADP-heptose:LPS heptosyltransferase